MALDVIDVIELQPAKCPLYSKGHNLHHMHLRLAGKGGWEDATIQSADRLYVTFTTDTGTHRGWNHDAHHLRMMLDAANQDLDAKARWSPNYHVLVVEAGDATYEVYLSDGPVNHCDLGLSGDQCV